MSDSTSFVQKHPPSPSREEREVDGYRAAFYPGFVRKLTVRDGGAETLIYEQDDKKPFFLPAGAERPWTSSTLEFSGGPGKRDIRFLLEDPHLQIARIEIVFKSADGERSGGGDGERLVVENTAVLCPPICPT
jgi:hypothetical protein